MVGAATLVTAALVQVELKKPLEQLPPGSSRRLEAAPKIETETKSGMVRIVQILFGETFTSPLAIKLVNISALGFLGALAFLFLATPQNARVFWFFRLRRFLRADRPCVRGRIFRAPKKIRCDIAPRQPTQGLTLKNRKSEIGNRMLPRLSRTAIIVAMWLVIIGGVLVFALVRNHIAKPTGMPLSETEFLQKFEANQIERATVSYNSQSSPSQ